MVTFITVLRALAACVITNSHYTGIYPTDFIANGGLLGDVIFFAVSGYCLYNVRLSFPKWYGRRLIRVYTPVLVITAVYMLIGAYTVSSDHSWIWWFVYPTYYHFVASIVLLYIPFYIIMRVDALKQNLTKLMIVIAAVYLLIYIIWYDKSYYHIDTVREPMIRFLFMESMLLGAWFKQNSKKIFRESWVLPGVASAVFFLIYMGSKLAFSRSDMLSNLQALNQVALIVLLYFVFRLFAALNTSFERVPQVIMKVVNFVADLTLEIYLVQYVLIDAIRPHFFFPLNWIVLTLLILGSAVVLHTVCKPIVAFATKQLERL